MLAKTSIVMLTALGLGLTAPAPAQAQEGPPPPPAPDAPAAAPVAPAPVAPAPDAPPPTEPSAPPMEPGAAAGPPPAPAPPASSPPTASFPTDPEPAPLAPPPAATAPAPSAPPPHAPRPAAVAAAAVAPAAFAPAPAPTSSAPEPAIAPAPLGSNPPAASPGADEGSEEEPSSGDGRIGWLGIGLKLGFQHFNETTIPVQLQSNDPTDPTQLLDLTITARNNTLLEVPIDIGGNGLGIQISPFLAKGTLKTSATETDVTTLGAFAGFMLRGRFGNLYPHLGLGMQAGYLKSDALEMGIDLYGRVPLGITYYLAEDLALVAEGGIAYGASGFKGHDIKTNYSGGPGGAVQVEVSQPDLKFGAAPAFDASIGIRLP